MIQFNVQDISEYRGQLMGIATLLVIFGHSVGNGVAMPRWMESHLQRMCIKMQGTENFLETESDAWLTGKEIVQLLSKLCLVHSFASFFSFSHSFSYFNS